MQTFDEQTNSILSDAVDLEALADAHSKNDEPHAGQRNLDAVRSLLAARYYERELLPPWERDLYDISFSGSDDRGVKYFVTDRKTGTQLHGPFGWATAYMRKAVEDPAATAPNHSTFCRCGADDACTWSRINNDKTGRQLGRSDEYNRETGEYEIHRWGEDEA